MVDIPLVAAPISGGGGAVTPSSPGSWTGGGTGSVSVRNGLVGVRAAAGLSNTGTTGFGRLAPFNPNTVYPPMGGGKWPGRVEAPPPGFGQTPDSGGSSQKGSSGDDGGQAESEPTERDPESPERVKGEDDKEPKKKKLRKAAKALKRPKQKNENHPSKHLGVNDLSQEGKSSSSGCKAENDPSRLPDDIIPTLGGIARDIQTQIPAMQQLLQNLPNELLNNFLSGMPPGLQSLIPSNVIPGLSNNGMYSLNSLIGLVGGGALGNAASDVMRSLLPNIGLPPQIAQQLTSVNLNQLFPGAQTGSGTTFAALAQTLSTIQLAAGSANNSGIPLNPSMLNQAVVTALTSTGLSNIIPTNIVGLANSLVQNPIGNIINAAMGGNAFGTLNGIIPIIPSNLSNPSTALLSGMNQLIPPQIAQNIMNPSQILGLLPANLQNIIPMVAPIMQGAVPNLIEQITNASPEKVAGSDIGAGNGGARHKEKEATNDGKDSKDARDIDYAQMLSPSFDLFQLSAGTAVNPGSNRLHKDDSGPEVDEIIKNLSSLANNVLEPLREAFPGMQIHSGYREKDGEHAKGKAVDVAWNVSPTRLMEIADWIRQNIPYKELIMEFQKTGWIHITYEKGSKPQSVTSKSAGGCEKGLVNRQG